MKRIIKSKLFYICIAIAVVLLVVGCFSDLITARDNVIPFLLCLDSTQSIGIISVVAPVVMSIPFLFFYTEELEKRAVYYQLLRTSRRKYYIGQILSAISSSGLISLISVVIFMVICLAFGVGWENTQGYFTTFDDTCLRDIVYSTNVWKLTLWYYLLLVFFCLPWALMGMVVSLFTRNRYVILASPFVLFMAWNYLTQMLYSVFHHVLWIMPIQPLMFIGLLWEDFWTVELTVIYPIVYHLILLMGLSLGYFKVTKRRFLREGV